MVWTHLAHDRDTLWALVNMVMKLDFKKIGGGGGGGI
jgi:hypothetical protein